MSIRVWRFCGRAYRFNPAELEPHLRACTKRLSLSGYAPLSIESYVWSVAHFGEWLRARGIPLSDVDDHVIDRFAVHRCRCAETPLPERLSPRYVRRVRRFVRYLADQHIVAQSHREPRRTPPIPLQVEFVHWMHQHRGVSSKTIDRHMRALAALLPILGSDVSLYDAGLIRRAVCVQAGRYCAVTARTFSNALRVYLRFLAAHGSCRPGLDQAVPLIAQWRLSALPRYLPAKDVERVVSSCDLSKPGGIRDRAILLLLARLGLRAGDILTLRLPDIDWREGTVRVCGKGRREVELPLPQDADEAVLAYLNDVRPQAATDRMFLCIPAPIRALQMPATVSDIVRVALLRAGIVDPPTRGANLLRHSAATSMLRAGATLDAVGSILRHCSSDTTAHYAKVDVDMLSQLVQPWPEGVPC